MAVFLVGSALLGGAQAGHAKKKRKGRGCRVGEWDAWDLCSVTCGGGVQHKRRPLLSPAANGKPCHKDLVRTRRCHTKPCEKFEGGAGTAAPPRPVPQRLCHVGEWQGWGGCSRRCGGGEQTSARHAVDIEPPHDGAHDEAAAAGGHCVGVKRARTRPCNTTPCPDGWPPPLVLGAVPLHEE